MYKAACALHLLYAENIIEFLFQYHCHFYIFVTKLQNQNLSIGDLYQNNMQKVETVRTGAFV